MSNQRLLAFCPTFLPHVGGAENTVLNLYTSMHEAGVQVTLLTLTPHGLLSEDTEFNFDVKRLFAGRIKNKILKFLFLQIQLIFYYLVYCRRNKITKIHVSYAFHSSIANFINKIVAGPDIIISEYHLGSGKDIVHQSENGVIVNWLCGLSYRSAKSIHAISQDNAQYIFSVSGRSDVLVTPQSADLVFFHPSKFCPDYRESMAGNKTFLLCSCSRIVPRKNIESLLELAHLLNERDVDFRLLIIGGPEEGGEEYVASLHEQKEALNLCDSVVFMGMQSNDSVATAYASSDLYVSCSKYEGFGLSFVEAMSSGTPIVSFNTKAIGDYLQNEVHGFYSEYNSTTEMADKIDYFLREPGRMAKMSRAVRDKAESEFGWDCYSQAIIKLIYG